ncbi:hypothetical protein Q5762_38010, partial [Streptomyces sp. P9(2023)]|nr:hypothetical protein [Streptomyces sp. P9(2023)]
MYSQFGSSLIAANGADTLQYWDLSTTSTTFVDLDAGAPSSKFVTVVRDFVVSGWESGNTNRVQWSGINDPTTWSSSAVTQSDFQ